MFVMQTARMALPLQDMAQRAGAVEMAGAGWGQGRGRERALARDQARRATAIETRRNDCLEARAIWSASKAILSKRL